MPVLVAGVLPLDSATDAHWAAAGAWQLPVGSPTDLGGPDTSSAPPYQVNRGLEYEGRRVVHQGVDLANGQGGGTVRAAAAGLVVIAHDGDNGNGYGGHVVIAHRLEDDGLVYTVYAHLERGSITAARGSLVCAGDALGRVGRTGRASTPHLHFEVRECGDANERWEKCRPVDPLVFVAERVGTPGGSGPRLADDPGPTYVEWAIGQGLLAAGAPTDGALTRATWWRALARGVVGGPRTRPDASADELRDSLIESGVLPEEEGGAPGNERLGWNELARDLKRVRQVGLRVPHGPLPLPEHEASCERMLGSRSPAAHAGSLRHLPGEPSVADGCVALADASGPRPQAHSIRPAHATRPARVHAGHRRRRAHRTARAPAQPRRRR